VTELEQLRALTEALGWKLRCRLSGTIHKVDYVLELRVSGDGPTDDEAELDALRKAASIIIEQRGWA
jgi:hypothetical protein